MKRRILVIGSGGREHAIAKKLKDSPIVDTVYCAKGNPGMRQDGIIPIDIDEYNHEGLIEFAKEQHIDWTIVGPETPLIHGIVDDFELEGLRIFGPTKRAAIIEGSKDFAKRLMTKYGIPTAAYASFSNYNDALSYVEKQGLPIVLKADGLAAGKGVTIAYSMAEVKQALLALFKENIFEEDNPKVVIEEFLEGEEFSLLSFVSRDIIYPMVSAKDHKPIYNGNKGPNTGGMGAYSPVPYVTESIYNSVIDTIIAPTIQAMRQENRPFEGILYTGLILTKDGPKVIEYNARFGDPETQVLLSRLTSDFAQVLEDMLSGSSPSVTWKQDGYDLGVVVASKGYPSDYDSHIMLPPHLTCSEDVDVFFAGVDEIGQNLVSNGGRVLLVTSSGETLQEAHNLVYDWLDKKDWSDFYYRTDIGL
ncbi:MAG: phosphoribosylamine--glycine ligase [Vagococcus sp.]